MNALTRRLVVDLPKSQYRIKNAPSPARLAVVVTVAVILVVAFCWAIGG